MARRGSNRVVVPFAPPLAAAEGPPEELPRAPSAAELGISGTTNWVGDIYDEANPRLYWRGAFGQPGNRTWGEWTKAIRTDPAFSAALEYIASMLRDAEVSVKPADIPNGEKHADMVKWNLFEAFTPGWPELIQRVVRGGLGYGFALEEKVAAFTKSKWLPNGLGWRLKRLAQREPVSVHQNGWLEEQQADGSRRLVSVRQWGQRNDGSFGEVVLPVSKLMLWSWNRTGNNYRGVSHGRPVYYPIRIREQLAKLIGVSLVREGAGIPVAEATDRNAKLTPKQREDLQTFLENCVFHENASMVLPAGWKMNWVFSGSANKGHVVDAYNALGIIILQQFQAQHLALGTQGEGNRAVGEVHTAMSRNFAQGVITWAEAVFNGTDEDEPGTGVVREMVQWNYGEQEAYPKINITLKRGELPPPELAGATKTAKDAGLFTVTINDENRIRESLGYEQIDEETRDAEKQKAVELMRQESALRAPDDGEDPEGDGGGNPFAKKARAMMGEMPWMPRRPLRPTEMRVDFKQIDDTLRTARADFEKGVRPLLIAALVELAPEIKDAMADGDPSEVGLLKLPTDKLSAFVDRFIADLRSAGRKEVAKEFAHGPADVVRRREEGDPAYAPTPPTQAAAGDGDDPKKKADDTARAMRKQLVRRMEQRILSDVEREALEAIRREEDESSVIERAISTQLDAGLRQDAGLLVTKAFNVGREEFAAERGDEVESVELSALLDGKQCQPCERLDGEEFEFNSPEHLAHVPPLSSICDGGDNCRCLLIYNLRRDVE